MRATPSTSRPAREPSAACPVSSQPRGSCAQNPGRLAITTPRKLKTGVRDLPDLCRTGRNCRALLHRARHPHGPPGPRRDPDPEARWRAACVEARRDRAHPVAAVWAGGSCLWRAGAVEVCSAPQRPPGQEDPDRRRRPRPASARARVADRPSPPQWSTARPQGPGHPAMQLLAGAHARNPGRPAGAAWAAAPWQVSRAFNRRRNVRPDRPVCACLSGRCVRGHCIGVG